MSTPVKRLAERAGIPVDQPEGLRSPEQRHFLELWCPDLLVIVAYGLLLPKEVLDLPRLGCVNLHASLLPAYRGAAPIQRAILDGCSETGVTVFQIDTGLDSGPILLQRKRPISPTETAGELHDALAELGSEVVLEVVEQLRQGRAHPQPQDPAQATYAPKVQRHEAALDWHRPAYVLERMVRAFNPWPVAYTSWAGEILRIWSSRVVEAAHSVEVPGTVLQADKKGLMVACGDRQGLELMEVQRPGRSRISGVAFVRGSSISVGQRLGKD